jgi:hypothetical protein
MRRLSASLAVLVGVGGVVWTLSGGVRYTLPGLSIGVLIVGLLALLVTALVLMAIASS